MNCLKLPQHNFTLAISYIFFFFANKFILEYIVHGYILQARSYLE